MMDIIELSSILLDMHQWDKQKKVYILVPDSITKDGREKVTMVKDIIEDNDGNVLIQVF